MIIELKNLYNQDLENFVTSNEFAWFYQHVSTTDKFPFLSHTLIPRYDIYNEDCKINSHYWETLSPVFYTALDAINFKLDKICRASCNLTPHINHVSNNDPHVDHEYQHYNFIYYFNTVDKGETIIYEEKFNGVDWFKDSKDLTVKKLITPEKNKGVIFDGLNYHANNFCHVGQWRFVMVVTFTGIPNE